MITDHQYQLKYIVIVILLLSISVARIGYAFQDIVIIQSKPGDIQFSHGIHGSLSCENCHHTAANSTEIVSCRKCHSKSVENAVSARDAFHKSCIGCHLREKKVNKKSGPAKLCSRCHNQALQ